MGEGLLLLGVTLAVIGLLVWKFGAGGRLPQLPDLRGYQPMPGPRNPQPVEGSGSGVQRTASTDLHMWEGPGWDYVRAQHAKDQK